MKEVELEPKDDSLEAFLRSELDLETHHESLVDDDVLEDFALICFDENVSTAELARLVKKFYVESGYEVTIIKGGLTGHYFLLFAAENTDGKKRQIHLSNYTQRNPRSPTVMVTVRERS